MWQLKTQFIAAVIFLASLCESQVTLDLCQPQILGSFCQVICQTPDLAQDVVFRKDGTEYASCKIVFGSKQCSTIGSGYTIGQFSNSASSITRVNITQVSRAQDDGVWTCEYGGLATSSKTFTVLTEPSGTNIITGDSSLNYCGVNNTNSSVTVQFTVSCSSQVDIKAVFAMSGNIYHTEDLTVSKGPACTNIKENTYSAEYNITHIDTLSGGPYSLSFKTQLSGVNGKEFETKSNSTYTFSCASKINKCACTITTVLGGVLGIPFTLLFDTVFMLVIYFAKNKEIIKKCKDKIVLTIVAVCIGVVLSCGIGAGVTSAVMSGKDTGYKSTGCKCAEYIGVLMSLGFSVLGSSVTSVIIYMFVFSRKEDGSVCNGLIFGECFDKLKKTCTCAVTPESKRGPPEGKEDNSENLEKSPDKSEKPTTIPEDDKPMATPRDLPPIQKSESILATMPPRQLPMPPINHQTVK